MSVRFVMELNSINKNFKLKKLLSKDMGYGVYENSYFLKEGKIGNPTIVYYQDAIGRGIELSKEDGKLVFTMPVPSPNKDVELLFELLDRAAKLSDVTKILYDEDKVDSLSFDELKQEVSNINKNAMVLLEEAVEKDDQNQIIIYGVRQVICLKKEEVKQVLESDEAYEHYLHHVQAQDLYFATANLYQTRNDIVALYTLSSDVPSSFPLDQNFLLDRSDVEITKWSVCFVDFEQRDVLGMVSYEEFLAHVDKSHMLDGQRFIVELSTDQLKELINQCRKSS